MGPLSPIILGFATDATLAVFFFSLTTSALNCAALLRGLL